MKIELEVSDKTEGTDSPYWLILDPVKNMRLDINCLAMQITGPFFSREAAETHFNARRYAFGKRACVYCLSGFWSNQYKNACRAAVNKEIV